MSLPHGASSRPPDIDWRWALPRIALLFVATRLLVLAVAVAVEILQPVQGTGVSVGLQSIVDSLTVWDGQWFLSIAETGYHTAPMMGADGNLFVDYAFYPLYPLATKVVALLVLGDAAIAGILLANVALALALVALYALSVRYLSPRRALLSLSFLLLAPGAAAFSLSYADSLFLLLAVGAFLAAERQRPWIAGVALALATLTRAPGLLLALPLLVLYVERDGWRPTRSWIPLALAPLALAGWFAYAWWLTGDPIAPVSAYAYWDAPQAALEGDAAVTAGSPMAVQLTVDQMRTLSVVLLGVVLFYVFLFIFFRHSPIRPAYWLVAILAVVGIVLAGTLVSAPRYLAVAWPFTWALAARHSRIGRGAVLVGFVIVQVAFLWLHFTWHLSP